MSHCCDFLRLYHFDGFFLNVIFIEVFHFLIVICSSGEQWWSIAFWSWWNPGNFNHSYLSLEQKMICRSCECSSSKSQMICRSCEWYLYSSPYFPTHLPRIARVRFLNYQMVRFFLQKVLSCFKNNINPSLKQFNKYLINRKKMRCFILRAREVSFQPHHPN